MSTIVLDARKIADFGIGTYIRGLIGGLSRLDHENRYVLLGDRAPDGLPDLPANFEWRAEGSPHYSLRELWQVSRAARRAGADLFHAPHYVVPAALACPLVVTVHDLIHLRFPGLRKVHERVYARTMIGRALRRARRTIAVSEATARELRETFGASARRVVTIPNGVDERFRVDLAPAELALRLERLGLERGYLLFVGNPKPHKNLATLLAAHARLIARREDAPLLVVAGGTPEIATRPRVRALGRVADDDLPALYQGATALVVPSLWEGFGLQALEAMASGVAVVAAGRGALPEVVGEAGLLIDPDDVESLAAGVEKVLASADLRAELGRRGRRRAAAYSWEITAQRTLAVYRETLEPAPGARA